MRLTEQQLRSNINKDLVENIEKATLRFVTQALLDFREQSIQAFYASNDNAELIAEDLTREALEQIGMPRTFKRIEGDVDYKRARYFIHPEYAVRQALMVDSKAEKNETNFSIQLAQTSMRVLFTNSSTGRRIYMRGTAPTLFKPSEHAEPVLTTTVIVKYNYSEKPDKTGYILHSIAIVAIPNGILQRRYNPSYTNTIWQVGRNSEQRNEKARVRVSVKRIKAKARWRFQEIDCSPGWVGYQWVE